jgi:peptide/nickel transport system ATP-binding protein
VSLDIAPGEAMGVVGESGSGKSTLARVISGLVRPSSGAVHLHGHALPHRRTGAQARLVQMAFQDPARSLNPHLSIGETIADALRATQPRRAERAVRVAAALESVGIDPGWTNRYPRELSGGQRQRVALARALAAEPDVLICDEVTSALDASTRAAVLELLTELRQRQGWMLLFISHDIGAVVQVSDRISVMYAGQVIEMNTTTAIANRPGHPYTRLLLGSLPVLGQPRRVPPDDFEPVDPTCPPAGCRFHPRCPVGPRHLSDREICEREQPAMRDLPDHGRLACHFADPEMTQDRRSLVTIDCHKEQQ